jgi:GWxTD domain-containing protein
MKKTFFLPFVIASFLLSCATVKTEKNTNPEDEEFLSTVRFIITEQEKMDFLNFPPSERKAFIEEFWKKRNPDPGTEVNKYKEEYLKRVKEAKHLFSGEGGPSGWLQDRGRVYILLGPPEQRETYPRGYNFYGPPMEIWHYGFYEIIFADYRWNGNYELQPQSARMLAEINYAQIQPRPEVKSEKLFFDFTLDIRKISEHELLIQISVPYKSIWLSSEENELKTTLEVSVEVYDASQKKIWNKTQSYPLSLRQETLKNFVGKDYVIEVPMRLEPGEYRSILTLKNLADQTLVKKTIKLTV